MKPTTFASARLWLLLLFAGLSVGLVSFDHEQAPGRFDQAITDTVPKTKTDRDKKVRDLDDVLDELNSVDIQQALEKAQKELKEAMKQFDGDKIRLQIEQSMKEVDMEKIMAEVRESMAKVDFDKIKVELANAMKEIDLSKLQMEISESMKDFDSDKLKKEFEKLKSIDMKEFEEGMKKLNEEMKELGPKIEKEMKEAQLNFEKAKEEMKEIGPKIEKEMKEAQLSLEKAKEEIKEYKNFVDGLANDGLINKKESYTLKHKDGELFINGKKVSDQTYNKYKNFLEKHKSFNIKKSDDDFDIDMD